MSLGDLLPDGAERHGSLPAVIDVHRTWTFEQADEAAGRLAGALVAEGIEPGDHVGVSLHKSGEGFIAMHGVVRAGAVAVPLDPGLPTGRLGDICARMGIRAVISQEAGRPAMASLAAVASVDVILGTETGVEGVRTVTASMITDSPAIEPVERTEDDAAYVITTSGSTGEPKGIVHTNASAMAYARMSSLAFSLSPADRVADIAPHHFDISTFALWSAPSRGAAIVVMPDVHQRMPASFSQRMADERVTVWYSVPFLLNQLAFRGDLVNRDLHSLRLVKLGGEVIQVDALRLFLEHAPNAVVANIYGPAEVNHCSHHVVDRSELGDLVPIGRPSGTAEFRIVPPESAAPVHEVNEGELWVAARTMMLGYFGESSPGNGRIAEWDGKRWYRTGDLVSRDVSGVHHFHGRVDHQVKVRGYRVELEAVESELESLAGVEAAVATIAVGSSGEPEIVAGVFATDGFDAARFLEAAREVLPAFAAPSQSVVLNSKQTTGSGKLDRRVLRDEVRARVEGTHSDE